MVWSGTGAFLAVAATPRPPCPITAPPLRSWDGTIPRARPSPGRSDSWPGDRRSRGSGLEVAVPNFGAGADEAQVAPRPPVHLRARKCVVAVEDVVAAVPVEQDRAGAAVDVVVAPAAGDEVVAASAADRVVAGLAEDPVSIGAAPDVVGARAAADDVLATAAVDRVAAAAADDHLAGGGAVDDDRAPLVRRVQARRREGPVPGSAERGARRRGGDGQSRDVGRGGQNDRDTAATAPQPEATCHVCLLVRGRGSWVAAASALDRRRTVYHRQHTSSSPH